MTLHREVHFEDEICADLAAAGWLQANGDAAGFDRARTMTFNLDQGDLAQGPNREFDL